ncbi:hypothetical protein [Rhizobium leguminosarum]|uniref:hypothetical protein n=1 Tax=Rhizobium leguminosarum TaxID=384 RepID=UPI001C90D401|nr:hypothetical protein [Rhizobium leguminosarum]MBY2998411.1 hypothetical protein [Rhizobium leguminosarum]
MDQFEILRSVGMDVDKLPENLRQHLQTLSSDELKALASLAKKASDAGVGKLIPSAANGSPGNCYY